MEYLAREDIWVTTENMPMRIKAFCKVVNDCKIAVINSNLSPAAQKEAADHEVEHLKGDDLYSDAPVAELESNVTIKHRRSNHAEKITR